MSQIWRSNHFLNYNWKQHQKCSQKNTLFSIVVRACNKIRIDLHTIIETSLFQCCDCWTPFHHCLYFCSFSFLSSLLWSVPKLEASWFDQSPNPEWRVHWSKWTLSKELGEVVFTELPSWPYRGQWSSSTWQKQELSRKQWYDSNRAWKAQKSWLGRVM